MPNAEHKLTGPSNAQNPSRSTTGHLQRHVLGLYQIHPNPIKTYQNSEPKETEPRDLFSQSLIALGVLPGGSPHPRSPQLQPVVRALQDVVARPPPSTRAPSLFFCPGSSPSRGQKPGQGVTAWAFSAFSQSTVMFQGSTYAWQGSCSNP